MLCDQERCAAKTYANKPGATREARRCVRSCTWRFARRIEFKDSDVYVNDALAIKA